MIARSARQAFHNSPLTVISRRASHVLVTDAKVAVWVRLPKTSQPVRMTARVSTRIVQFDWKRSSARPRGPATPEAR